ncbi:50S ribosomal protein L25 [Bacillus sp. FJAT-27916]|uniref:50S ribosomal protein L25/general stress protein Ctc n=1 Tax=Bacillaceae TaxID=186817 RepID=UPI0006711BAD|nr:50S ribosomal protein L25/general stress protein Ctc [Bacillus sp. FJAT-27916]KMY46161.1 50S ribosomal protein L25 [Bacillus sp. FJAT-27916]
MAMTLQATKREEFKRSSLRKLRENGKFPAVVYGNNKPTSPIYVDEGEFLKAMKESGRNGVLALDLGGQKESVMLGEYQQDSIKGHMIHADFLVVNMSEELEVDVRIDLVGEAAGVKEGGVIQQSLHEVTVSAKPNEIPASIEYDISNLQIGDTIIVADLNQDGDYTITQDEDEVIASILAPRVEAEADEGAVEGAPEEAPAE